MNDWISVKDKLPNDNQYVLGIHTRGTWRDSDDPVKVNYVVLKFERGKDMSNPKIGDAITSNDKNGNNLVPYGWNTFGPDHFFGQDISHWMPLPDKPK